jgi:hypothetical protein
MRRSSAYSKRNDNGKHSVFVYGANPRGVRVPLETAYEKYRGAGFTTPSGKIEIFPAALRAGCGRWHT